MGFATEKDKLQYRRKKSSYESLYQIFGNESIAGLLADREFIGEEWFEALIVQQTPFYIRVKANMKIRVPGKGEKKAF